MNYSINYLFRFATANLGSLTSATAAATAMATAMGRAGTAVAALGVVGAAGGAALGGLFVAAIKEAAKFEDKMAEVRKVVPDMTKETMWAMGKEVQRLAIWSGESKENIADIFAGGARMGIRGTEALSKFAETVTKVAVAWDGVSASVASESMGRITGQFFGNLDASTAQDRMRVVADSINYLGQNIAGAKPSEILKFFQRAGNIMAQTGLSANEAAAWGATAVSAGVSGSMEGTQASASIWRMMTKARGKQGVKAFKAMGWDIRDFDRTVKTEGRTAGMLKLMEKVASIPDKNKAIGALGQMLGDQRAARQLVAMSGQLNKFKYALASTDVEWAKKFMKDPKWVEWLRNTRPDELERLTRLTPRGQTLAAGSVDQEFNARMDSMVKQMARVREAWDYVLVQMGKGALPVLTPWVSSLADALERLGTNQGVLEYIAKGATTLAGVATAAGIGLLTTKLLGLGGTAGIVVRALGGLLAFSGMALAITIAVAGISTVYWIYDNWERVKQLLADPINVDIHFPDMPDWLKWVWKNSFKDSKDIIGDAWNTQGKDPYRYSEGDFNRAQKYNTVPNFGRRSTVPNFYPLGAPPDRTWGQWLSGTDPTWGATPFGSATSAIPGAMNQRIDVNATTTFQPATLAIQYNGPLGGPDSVSLQANPARGQSTAEGGGGSGRPWAQ